MKTRIRDIDFKRQKVRVAVWTQRQNIYTLRFANVSMDSIRVNEIGAPFELLTRAESMVPCR
jgi:hypothetical protein